MTRPTFEVADILRAQGDRFLDRYRSSFDFQQLKAFRAILRCRTAALGGHRDACPNFGHQAISYNSCRNRHCPKCQTQARERWLAARERELLTTSYFHVVFTSDGQTGSWPDPGRLPVTNPWSLVSITSCLPTIRSEQSLNTAPLHASVPDWDSNNSGTNSP